MNKCFTKRTPKHLQAHFIFYQRTMLLQKNKKNLQANPPYRVDIYGNLIRHNFGQTQA